MDPTTPPSSELEARRNEESFLLQGALAASIARLYRVAMASAVSLEVAG